MKKQLAIFLFISSLSFLIIGSSYISPKKSDEDKKLPSVREFMFDAVKLGLIEMNFMRWQCQTISEINGYFIPKCVICDATRSAFKEVAKIPQDSTKTVNYRRVLTSGSPEEPFRLEAFDELIQELVKNHYARLEFTQDQVDAMNEKLNAEKKKSMALANGRKCPSCDGSTVKYTVPNNPFKKDN